MYFSPHNVKTVYIHEHTCICIHVCVHACSDHVVQVQTHDYVHANHYATSMIVIETKVTVYLYCFTWRLVTYGRRRTSGAPRPRHDVAGQIINIDLFKAEVHCEAGLGDCHVAVHSCLIEEQHST